MSHGRRAARGIATDWSAVPAITIGQLATSTSLVFRHDRALLPDMGQHFGRATDRSAVRGVFYFVVSSRERR